MTTNNISTELFINNSYIKSGKILLAIFIVLDILAGIVITLNESMDLVGDNPVLIIIAGMAAVAGMIIGLAGLILVFKGLNGRKQFNKFIDENGEDAFLSEIANDTLYIYSRKDKPITVITRKHIFEVGGDIMDTPSIDYAYGYSYKGSTCVHAYTINNKLKTFANGIALRGNDMENVFNALRNANSSVLLGFTHDNNKEHRARVKEYKQNGML